MSIFVNKALNEISIGSGSKLKQTLLFSLIDGALNDPNINADEFVSDLRILLADQPFTNFDTNLFEK